jgi:hypothetical protein
MTGKFGHYDSTIAASWLWARIHKRTSSLLYIEGGFQTLVNALADAIKKQGGKIYLKSEFKCLDLRFVERFNCPLPSPKLISQLSAVSFRVKHPLHPSCGDC